MSWRSMSARAAASADDLVVRLHHVAGARQDQAHLLVGYRHDRLQAAQVAVSAPILGELDARARQLAGMFLQARLQALEQRERVGSGAGEARDHLVALQPAHLGGAVLEDGVLHGHLAIAGDDHFVVLAHRDDGGAVPRGGGFRHAASTCLG